jgi:uncharacterized protein
MTLKENIDNQIKQAMRDKAADRLRALRAIKSLILLEETKEGGSSGISSDDEMKLLIKAAKQRKDSATIYQEQGRADLLEKELAEIAVIEEFLPQQLSPDELQSRLQAIVERVGAKTMADLGKVMGVATKELAGVADGKAIQATVKSLLG